MYAYIDTKGYGLVILIFALDQCLQKIYLSTFFRKKK